MDHIYAKRKAVPEFSGKGRVTQEQQSAAPVTSLRGAPEAGSAKRLDLSDAIRTKMENAFGADLSSVRLYESEAVAEHGAGAVAQGNTIAFAPGLHDFSSRTGQEILGHELSHVVSQQRGEVTGSGFLNSPALEARADREGAMAAAGEQVYDGPVTGPLSGATADAAAAGPMQAWDKHKNDPPANPREFTSNDKNQAHAFFGTDANGLNDPWSSALPQDERDAVHDYTKDRGARSFKAINTSLRTGKWQVPSHMGPAKAMTSQQKSDAKKQIGALDRAISKSTLPEPLVVHRGSGPELVGGLTDPDAIMKRYGNRVVKDKGFVSTSAVKGSEMDKTVGVPEEEKARAVHYRITVPAGKGRGAYIAPISQFHAEEEFLLKRNAGYIVRGASKNERGVTVVDLQMQI